MSIAFQKHHYDLKSFATCPDCLAPIVEVHTERACLYEWLKASCLGKYVHDIVPLPDDLPEDEYRSTGVVLTNGFMLPVDRAFFDYDLTKPVKVNDRLVGLEISDVVWAKSWQETGEVIDSAAIVELSTEERKHTVALFCNLDVLVYLLTDELFRKVEP